jgi:redox-sensitive bicupin YhaK (pirin superfamily)
MSGTSGIHASVLPGAAAALPGVKGEHVVFTAPATVRRGGPALISGRFGLSAATFALLAPSPHRHLAVTAVLGAGSLHHADCPYAEVALFPEDVQLAGALHVGYFHVDLALDGGLGQLGRWWITASIGPIVSQPVGVTVS